MSLRAGSSVTEGVEVGAVEAAESGGRRLSGEESSFLPTANPPAINTSSMAAAQQSAVRRRLF